MPKSLLFALLLLVAAPLVLLGWLSAAAYKQQQRQAQERLSLFFLSRLSEIDRSLSQVFDEYERTLRSHFEDRTAILDGVRQLDLENPIVRSSLYVNRSGILIYPPKPQPEQAENVSLFAALPAIIRSRPDLGTLPALSQSPSQSRSATRSRASNQSPIPQQDQPGLPQDQSRFSAKKSVGQGRGIVGRGKWQVWYMDEGVQLIYWMQHSEGGIIGVLLERARWMADLTTQLPNTAIAASASEPDRLPPPDSEYSATYQSGFTALTDEAKRIIYRWGDEGPRQDQPLARLNLAHPLANWQLEYHNRDSFPGPSSTLLLVAPIVGTGVTLLALGIYVLTRVQRQMRSARQKVSFASQVSHELRTPLTNIRLYAELAEKDLQTLSESQTKDSIGRRLHVIDTESRRLGRLVSGVLEVIRDPRKQGEPRLSWVIPDEVIDHTLTQFTPSFEKTGLLVHRRANAAQRTGMDSDILELILVNLLSNVEKYATSGGHVTVHSQINGDQLTVDVFDQGPGIPWRSRNRVFRPFVRLDDSIHAPSGTGIGLPLARQLAKRHGGDLRLIQNETHRGACFRLQIKTTPPIKNTPTEATHNQATPTEP